MVFYENVQWEFSMFKRGKPWLYVPHAVRNLLSNLDKTFLCFGINYKQYWSEVNLKAVLPTNTFSKISTQGGVKYATAQPKPNIFIA